MVICVKLKSSPVLVRLEATTVNEDPRYGRLALAGPKGHPVGVFNMAEIEGWWAEPFAQQVIDTQSAPNK
jgi:hypothetical protein